MRHNKLFRKSGQIDSHRGFVKTNDIFLKRRYMKMNSFVWNCTDFTTESVCFDDETNNENRLYLMKDEFAEIMRFFSGNR